MSRERRKAGAPRREVDAAPAGSMTAWNVYMVCCADESFYTGIARDVGRRVEEHNSSERLGSHYTRARRPVVLVYREPAATRSDALKREYRIRQLSREEKEFLVKGQKRGEAWREKGVKSE